MTDLIQKLSDIGDLNINKNKKMFAHSILIQSSIWKDTIKYLQTDKNPNNVYDFFISSVEKLKCKKCKYSFKKSGHISLVKCNACATFIQIGTMTLESMGIIKPI